MRGGTTRALYYLLLKLNHEMPAIIKGRITKKKSRRQMNIGANNIQCPLDAYNATNENLRTHSQFDERVVTNGVAISYQMATHGDAAANKDKISISEYRNAYENADRIISLGTGNRLIVAGVLIDIDPETKVRKETNIQLSSKHFKWLQQLTTINDWRKTYTAEVDDELRAFREQQQSVEQQQPSCRSADWDSYAKYILHHFNKAMDV